MSPGRLRLPHTLQRLLLSLSSSSLLRCIIICTNGRTPPLLIKNRDDHAWLATPWVLSQLPLYNVQQVSLTVEINLAFLALVGAEHRKSNTLLPNVVPGCPKFCTRSRSGDHPQPNHTAQTGCSQLVSICGKRPPHSVYLTTADCPRDCDIGASGTMISKNPLHLLRRHIEQDAIALIRNWGILAVSTLHTWRIFVR